MALIRAQNEQMCCMLNSWVVAWEDFFLGASNSVVIPQFGRFVEFTSQANSWGLGIVRTY